ncbi:MAG: hypothetical protein NT121_15980 [Chloroflexi bacterium]|nr:hypothetical protein [Chloroflexota bacterium]
MLLGLIVVAWLVFRPGWIPALPENKFSKTVISQADQVRIKSRGWYKQIKPFWKKETNLGNLLKAWASNQDLVTAAGFSKAQVGELALFLEWIESIPDQEANLVAEELSTFCCKQGINIRWLLDDNGRGDMQGVLSTLVLFYGLAVRERYLSRPAAALRAWEDAPLSKVNRDFGNLLYIRLVDADLIKIPAHLLLAPEKDRLAHLVSAIKALVEKDRNEVLPFAAQVMETKQASEPKINSSKKKKLEPVAFEQQSV